MPTVLLPHLARDTHGLFGSVTLPSFLSLAMSATGDTAMEHAPPTEAGVLVWLTSEQNRLLTAAQSDPLDDIYRRALYFCGAHPHLHTPLAGPAGQLVSQARVVLEEHRGQVSTDVDMGPWETAIIGAAFFTAHAFNELEEVWDNPATPRDPLTLSILGMGPWVLPPTLYATKATNKYLSTRLAFTYGLIWVDILLYSLQVLAKGKNATSLPALASSPHPNSPSLLPRKPYTLPRHEDVFVTPQRHIARRLHGIARALLDIRTHPLDILPPTSAWCLTQADFATELRIELPTQDAVLDKVLDIQKPLLKNYPQLVGISTIAKSIRLFQDLSDHVDEDTSAPDVSAIPAEG